MDIDFDKESYLSIIQIFPPETATVENTNIFAYFEPYSMNLLHDIHSLYWITMSQL